jgi:hypothetical protein
VHTQLPNVLRSALCRPARPPMPLVVAADGHDQDIPQVAAHSWCKALTRQRLGARGWQDDEGSIELTLDSLSVRGMDERGRYQAF